MGVTWFDLKNLGAKLERPADEQGNFFMKLTFEKAVEPQVIVDAAKSGWVAENGDLAGRAFSNYGTVGRVSEIVAMLSPFLPEEAVIATKTDSSRLRQNEVIKGFVAPLSQAVLVPPVAEVASNMLRMPEGKRDVVLARVAAAQKTMGVAAGADGASLFMDNGMELWGRLRAKFGGIDATKAMYGVIRLANAKGERFGAAHDALLKAAETGEGLPCLDDEMAGFMVGRALKMREYMGSMAGKFIEERFLRQMIQWSKLNYRAWDGAAFPNAENPDAPELFGAVFRADPGIPKAWRHDIGHRVSAAISGMAEALGISPRELFQGARQIIHLGTIGPDAGGAEGYMQSGEFRIAGQRVEVKAIKITPFTSGALIHELWHAVDRNARSGPSSALSEDMLRAMTLKSGLMDEVQEFVGRARAEGGIDDKHAHYLMTPEELIARAGEAVMTDRAFTSGDPNFRNLGGIAMLSGEAYFQPTPETAARFLVEARSVVKESLDRRAEEDCVAAPDVDGPGL